MIFDASNEHRPSPLWRLLALLVAAALAWCAVVAGAAAAEPPPTAGRAVWPLSPRPAVLRGFAPPAQDWLSGHRGVDLAAQPGQAVLAPRAGVVLFAGPLAGRGVLSLGHGTTRSTFEPVVPLVPVGSSVAAGARLGVVADRPGHCGGVHCLHWGLIRGDHYLNPLLLLWGPPRLLPVWTTAGATGRSAVTGAADRRSALPTRSAPAATQLSNVLGPAALGTGGLLLLSLVAFGGRRSHWFGRRTGTTRGPRSGPARGRQRPGRGDDDPPLTPGPATNSAPRPRPPSRGLRLVPPVEDEEGTAAVVPLADRASRRHRPAGGTAEARCA